MAAHDLFAELDARPELNDVEILVSFFEIYGGRCQDLLNARHRLEVCSTDFMEEAYSIASSFNTPTLPSF